MKQDMKDKRAYRDLTYELYSKYSKLKLSSYLGACVSQNHQAHTTGIEEIPQRKTLTQYI